MSNQPWVYYPHRFREFNGRWLVVHNMTDPDTTVAEFSTMEEAAAHAHKLNQVCWAKTDASPTTSSSDVGWLARMLSILGLFHLLRS
jgi:hypothetical protein